MGLQKEQTGFSWDIGEQVTLLLDALNQERKRISYNRFLDRMATFRPTSMSVAVMIEDSWGKRRVVTHWNATNAERQSRTYRQEYYNTPIWADHIEDRIYNEDQPVIPATVHRTLVTLDNQISLAKSRLPAISITVNMLEDGQQLPWEHFVQEVQSARENGAEPFFPVGAAA